MSFDFSVFKGKKVFVTGHTGFKGAWMLSVLRYLGAHTKGYALAGGKNELFDLIKGNELCESVIDDIRNLERLKREIASFEPDIIFHLAAQPLVRASYQLPDYTFDVNVMGTVSLLEALRVHGRPCIVVIITTDKVYENFEWPYLYRENDRLGGYDPYSASKACAEIVVGSYRQSFFNAARLSEHGIKVATARAGNVIGGGDWAQDRIIPDIVRALTGNQPIEIRNPSSVRPWQHVLEPISGYLQLAALMSRGSFEYLDSWNFGPLPEDNLSVMEIAEKALGIWGTGSLQTAVKHNSPHEAHLLKLDISKALTLLNWRPKWNANRAIWETINWYKVYSNSKKDLTFEQIISYFEED